MSDSVEEELYMGVTHKKVPQDPQPVWEDDKDVNLCRTCKVSFGLFTRRHHCRGCGKILCIKDCDNWLMLPPSMGYGETVVCVCDPCYRKYSLIDYSKAIDEFGPKNAPTIIFISGALTPRIIPPCIHQALTNNYHVIGVGLPGGYAAMKFGLAHPELCHGLILGGCCNEHPPGFGTNMFFEGVSAVYQITSNKRKSTFVDYVLPKTLNRSELNYMFMSGMDYSMWNACGSIMKEPQANFYRKALASFPFPVLLVHGEHDYRTAEKAFMEAATPLTKLIVIKGADHLILFTPGAREELGAAVKKFVDEVYVGGASSSSERQNQSPSQSQTFHHLAQKKIETETGI